MRQSIQNVYLVFGLNLFLLLMQSSCIQGKKSNFQSEVKALSPLESQENLEEYLEIQLVSLFKSKNGRQDLVAFEKSLEKILPPAQVKNRDRVLETLLIRALQNTSLYAQRHREELGGVILGPQSLVKVVRKVWTYDYILVNQRGQKAFVAKNPGFMFSHLALTPEEVIPFFTRLVTKRVRSVNKMGGHFDSPVDQMLGTQPLSPGSLRDLVFHSMQRRYPQLALSSKINDVYIVSEFHKKTLDTIYFDAQDHVNKFLVAENIKKSYPSLTRIYGKIHLLQNLASHLEYDTDLRHLLPVTMIVTDLVDAKLVGDLKGLLGKNKKFAQFLRGIGFSNNVDPSFQLDLGSMLVDLMRLFNPSLLAEIWLNMELIEEKDLKYLVFLKRRIILDPSELTAEYYKVLPELEAIRNQGKFTQSCLNAVKPMDKKAYAANMVASKLLEMGIQVDFTTAAKSALMLAVY